MQVVFNEHGFVADSPDELSYNSIYDLAFGASEQEDPGLNYLVRIARQVVDDARSDPDLAITRAVKLPSAEALQALLEAMPFCIGSEFITEEWLADTYNKIAQIFNSELSSFNGTPEEYIKSKDDSLTVCGRVFFHLVETKDEDFPFAFMATYSTRQDATVAHLPLKRALEEFTGDQSELLGLLASVGRAASESRLMSELVETGELFHPLRFEPADAYDFLREVPLYESCGIVCRIPDFWRRSARPRLALSLGAGEPSALGLQSLIDFSPCIYFGDTELSREELQELLAQDNGLAFFKGKWVEVSRERIEQVLSALERIEGRGSLTLAEALRLKAGLGDDQGDEAEVQTGIEQCQWLEQLVGKMRDPRQLAAVPLSGDFHAELRSYQQAGLSWLELMRGFGFGALLADDMGLGKTVQVLALLDSLRERNGSVKALIVVPASLLANWQKEAERFAPKLRVCVVHGAGANYEQSQAELFITTYGMVARLEQLSADAWDLLILDEAQAIKNPGIKQTKAVKNLKATVRLAMTGTPIENRLADLWSIFDFLNTGLLGSAKEFKRFAAKLKHSPSGYARLRNILAPFILRRLKTDKTVISDLPEKNEIIRYTTLSKRQAAQYSALVKELEESFAESASAPDAADPALAQASALASEGIARKGRILAAIMKFKQICNHPDQYIGQGAYDPRHSGKFDALAEICETIKSKHESVLVFTQFRELCEPLADYLQQVFGRPGVVIHGGTTPKQRGKIVERFNTEYLPFMVLSLKAGGVGLNLTAANHVIHFDRWWNPAIENQATDRAFRIGQTKDVMVHKFVTTGTIEEKIDAIISSKQQLANDVIAPTSGEGWVTEMSNRELLDLFRLEV